MNPADFMDIWIRDNVTDWQYTGDVEACAVVKADQCLREAAVAGISDAMIRDDLGAGALALIRDAMVNRPEVEFAAQQLAKMPITKH
jgi:hypothetical protein